MNILVICHYGMYADFSRSFVHAQTAALAALGHRVRAVIPIAVGKRDWDGKRFSGPICCRNQDGVEIYAVRHLSLSKYGKGGFNKACALRVLSGNVDKVLEGFAPDVIRSHTLGFDSEIGALFKERLGVPLVMTSHGSDASIPIEQGRGAELRRYCDKADAVVAVSSVLAGKIRACGTKTPVFPIMNGFRIYNLPKGETTRTLSLAQVGTLNHQKRPHTTLQAFAQLLETHPKMTLTFIGQGPERNSLEKMSRELGVSGSVRFLGQLSNSGVLAELAKAQFFVLPSVREGFGTVYLEAMASGCITIGTEGEGVTDLIVSGENGFLIPPDDPNAIVQVIEWCLEHPDGASAIAERGRKGAMDLTWEKNAKQYLKLFEELLHDGKMGSK